MARKKTKRGAQKKRNVATADGVDVICQECNWNRPACPENELPTECPNCRSPFGEVQEIGVIAEVDANPPPHRAWTGGSPPRPLRDVSPDERAYARELYADQATTWRGHWGDEPPLDVRRTFASRARHDAHATFRHENPDLFEGAEIETQRNPEKFRPGDRVKWTAAFLKSTGQYTRPRGSRGIGVVVDRATDLDPERFVVVQWDDGSEPAPVNVANIMRAGRPDTSAMNPPGRTYLPHSTRDWWRR